ncbi:hypothetical protein WR25_07461 [Diploscapter pachys]|uniref:Abnormal cell migration protein 18-like fibronectin type I domain-containing protein n=1 Tax=Diploscapter pachys TaxID=2018661 RepID=A0A2A2JTM2_9BILA|nr:hypothetical protein WR25_07461 [Diploscapter pachys]
MSSFWVLVSLTTFVVGPLNLIDAAPDSMIRHFVINETASMQKAFDQMPKECTKNGKTFKEGESFEFGNLRYKCQKYGVYSIEGCQTDDKKPIALGESTVINDVKHQCLSVGNSIHYRQTPSLKTVNIPEGWTVIDGGSNKIPNTNATVITRILMFNAIPGQHQRQRN